MDKKKKVKTSTVALIIICIFLIIFTGVNLWLFYMRSAVPDSLIIAVYSATLGELSILGVIRTSKLKYGDEDEEIDIEEGE